MITEAEIEAAIADKIASAFEAASAQPRIVGSWNVEDEGRVKGQGDASPSVIAVAVGIRAYDSFCSPQADFNCSAVLSIRRDACPTGAKLANDIEPLLGLIARWNEDVDHVCDDLTTATFSPAGFRLESGARQQTKDAWIVTLNFTLRGVISDGS